MEKEIFRLFKEYYKNLSIEEIIVDEIEKREFAFFSFDSGVMKRHISFKEKTSLKNFLETFVPLHAYYSVSLYMNPSIQDMQSKGILKTELVFDIDIDHVKTPCKSEHDVWYCRSCGQSGKGFSDFCPYCKGNSIEKETFVCNDCLEFAKSEVLKLIEDFLFTDFGLSKDEVLVVFSGNRGYHVHVKNEYFSELDSRARSMIVDYIKGISARLYLLDYLKKNRFKFKGLASTGFPSRLAEKIFENLFLHDFNIDKEEILRLIHGYTADYSFLKKLGKKAIEIIQKSIAEISVEIDERVTVDTHRLIRLPNSLHGKTGLKVFPLSYKDLNSFDPFKHAIVFKKGFARIKSKRKIRNFRMGDYSLDIDPGETKEVPLFLALYLYLSDNAIINEFF